LFARAAFASEMAPVAPGHAKQAEQAYLDRIQNAWRNAGNNAQQNQPPMRAARLTTDAADPAHNAHQAGHRFDGQMVLERTDANGFENGAIFNWCNYPAAIDLG
jgi:hypothetical protein